MIFACQILRKFDINSLYICPPYLVYCSHFTLWNPKSFVNSITIIHTSYYLRYGRKNQIVILLPTTPKMLQQYLVNAKKFIFFIFHAYRVPIRDMVELRKRLVATWAEFQQSVVYDAVDQ